jgi:endonuclease YncB( thermonuclease family)
MGFRFPQRCRLAPGIILNLSKRGISVSAGGRGTRVTLGGRGPRAVIGIPRTGLSYSGSLSRRGGGAAPVPPMSRASIAAWVAFTVLLCVAAAVGTIALDDPGQPAATQPTTPGTASSTPAAVSPTVRVIDGDTFDLGGQRIRLWGIDAPEARQQCHGRDGQTYNCGQDATAVLRELLRGRRTECDKRDHDRYQRTVAVCRTEAGEVNAVMVRRGWAVDYVQYSGGRYQAEETAAKAERLGIWSGRFELPSQWRAERR